MVFPLLVLNAVLASAAGDCRCICLNGIPSTLCTNVLAAQQKPDLCPLEMRCPPLLGTVPAIPLTAPQAGAVDCRKDQLWNPSTASYTVRNVCAVELADEPAQKSTQMSAEELARESAKN